MLAKGTLAITMLLEEAELLVLHASVQLQVHTQLHKHPPLSGRFSIPGVSWKLVTSIILNLLKKS
jgi:hypothetical protein